MKTWLTVREAAPVLRMSEQAVYCAVREHQLPDAAILRIGRRIRIDPNALHRVEADEEGKRGESEVRDVG